MIDLLESYSASTDADAAVASIPSPIPGATAGFNSESTVASDHGQLAAGVASLPTPAAFSFRAKAIRTIPFGALQNRHRFDQYFNPEWFLADIDEPPLFLNPQRGV